MSVGAFFQPARHVPHVTVDPLRAEEARQEERRGLLRVARRQSREAARRRHGADDLHDRLMLPLINEAVAVLRERIVEDAPT